MNQLSPGNTVKIHKMKAEEFFKDHFATEIEGMS